MPGPETILNDVKKLPAGHFIKIDIDNEKFSLNKWWDITIKNTNFKSLKDVSEEIKFTLEQSVKRATLSDVPLACGLSGGLDSQSIVGLLTKNNYKVNTFTMGFDGHEPGDLNEIDVSRIASENFKTEHNEMIIGVEEYFYSPNLCLIEWASKIEALIPENNHKLNLDYIDNKHRKLIFS